MVKAIRWAKISLLPMAMGLALISIATPIVSDLIALRWFVLPNIIGLLPISLFSGLLIICLYWVLNDSNPIIDTYPWLAFTFMMLLCLLATISLAYSIYPDIIIGQMTIWQAAADHKSLQFVFYGVVITLPVIIFYTLFVYRIFAGKASQLSYD